MINDNPFLLSSLHHASAALITCWFNSNLGVHRAFLISGNWNWALTGALQLPSNDKRWKGTHGVLNNRTYSYLFGSSQRVGLRVNLIKDEKVPIKLGPHDVWFVFVMRHVSWFTHRVYEKMCLIWVGVSFVHLSHLVRQFGGKLTHQSKLYVSDSTIFLNTFTHNTPQIRTMHRVDPA